MQNIKDFEISAFYNQKRDGYINSTIQIIDINYESKEVVYTFLFCLDGFVDTIYLESPCYHENFDYFLSNSKYEKVTDISQFHVYCHKMDLNKSLNENIVSIKSIEHLFRDQSNSFPFFSPHTSYHAENGTIIHYIELEVVNKPKEFPLLETIICTWTDIEDLQKDIKSVFPNAYFLYKFPNQ